MKTKHKGLFIAATGQNVGKTTICLGMIALLQKQFSQLGVIKPVGQQHVRIGEDLLVDKDVVLFKEHFSLPFSYQDMSPVIFPRGFTRDYLDGKIDHSLLERKIFTSFEAIASSSPFTLVEGTGHVGVGSVVELNNAKVAKLLGLDVIIIAKGGIGSTIDELALNISLCHAYGIKVAGVILNRVQETKREIVMKYVQKALKKWDIPLLGAIPYNLFLNTPTMKDFASLFSTSLITGEKWERLHFTEIRLVATSVTTFKEIHSHEELLVTPATREDILHALLDMQLNASKKHGIILTGRHPPSKEILERLETQEIPTIYTPVDTFEAMQKINSFTAKIQVQDTEKVEKAIALVENHLQVSAIL